MSAVILQTELSGLIQESKRRHPDVKAAAEKSLSDLKAIPLTSEAQLAGDLLRKHSFVDPFILACKSRHAKLVTSSVICLQRLTAIHALSTDRLKDILDAFRAVTSTSFDVQIKILQTLPSLFQTYPSEVCGGLLFTCLEICGALQGTKTTVVSSTASATLQQLVSSAFERIVDEDDSARPGPFREIQIGDEIKRLGNAAIDAFEIFDDLCSAAEGVAAKRLKPSTIPPVFVFDLLFTILNSNDKVFRDHSELLFICRRRLMPLIIRRLSGKPFFPITIRSLKILFLLVSRHLADLEDECETALALLIHLLEPEASPSWTRVASMEMFRNVTQSFPLLRQMFDCFDSKKGRKDIVSKLMVTLAKVAAEEPTVIGLGHQSTMPTRHTGEEEGRHEQASLEAAGVEGVIGGIVTAEPHMTGISSVWSLPKAPILEQLDKNDAPAVPETYMYSLVLDCMIALSEGLTKIITPMGSWQSERKRTLLPSDVPLQQSNKSGVDSGRSKSVAARPTAECQTTMGQANSLGTAAHPHADSTKTATELVTSCWPAFLAICATFLNAALDAEYNHSLIRAIQKLAQVASVLGLSTPRNAFLTTLAKAAVPAQVPQPGLTTDARKYESSPLTHTINEAGSYVTNSISEFVSESRVSTKADVTLLTARNLLCVRALVNLGIALGPTFSQEAWFILLETLREAEHLITSSPPLLMSQDGKVTEGISTNEAHARRANLSGEIAAVQTAASKLLASTAQYDGNGFRRFLRALLSLSSLTQSLFDRQDVVTEVGSSSSRPATGMHQSLRSESGPLFKAVTEDTEVCFVLGKTSEVARSNLQRFVRYSAADSGWSLITDGLLRLIRSSNAAADIRLRAARLLNTITLGILQILDDVDASLQKEVQDRCISVLQIQIDGLYQQGTSFTLESRNVDLQIHEDAIETLISIVEKHGEKLLVSWEKIFRLGRTIFEEQAPPFESDKIHDAQAKEVRGRSVKLISIGFRLLQLIGSDFLNLLPLQHLLGFIETLLLFGRQQDDMNASLTSTTFFWNLADYLHLGQNDPLLSGLTDVPTEEFLVRQITRSEDPANVTGSLWLVLLLRLNILTMDPRSEVRNGAIRVMLRIMDASGRSLSPRGWHICLSLILMRLLESHASLLAMIRPKGPDSDYQSFREWCASTVALLEGSINLVCLFVGTISADEHFPKLWEQVFEVLGSILEIPSLAIFFAGFHGVTLLFSSLKRANYSNVRISDPALRLWLRHHPADIVDHSGKADAGANEQTSNQEAFTAHAEVLLRLSESLPSVRLDQIAANEMMQALKKTIFRCVHPPFESDVYKMAPEQEHVVAILQMFSGTPTSRSPEYYETLFDFIQATSKDDPGSENARYSDLAVKPDQTLRNGQSPSFVALSSRCMDLLEGDIVALVRHKSVTENSLTISLALNVLSNTIKAKYVEKVHRGKPLLWRKATASGLAIVQAIGSCNYVMNDKKRMHAMNEVYGSAVEIAAGILSYGGLEDMDQLPEGDILAADEGHDMAAFKSLSSTLIPALTKLKDAADTMHCNLTSEIHRRFVINLFHASMIAAPQYGDLPSDNDLVCSPLSSLLQVRPGTIKELVYHVRSNVPHLALETLFRLTATFEGDKVQEPDAFSAYLALAKTAAPYALLRTAHTLKSFIADQPLRGPLPMPFRLRAEMLYVLRLCLELRTEDEAYISRPRSSECARGNGKRHLQALYSLILSMWKVWRRVPRYGFSWINDEDGVEIENCLHRWMELCNDNWNS